MTRDAVLDALRSSAVHLDTGHHPGRDRMPREAAAPGAVVLAANRGAGCFELDVPVDARCRIDMGSPVLDGARKVRQALDDLGEARRSQDRYRERVAHERTTFDEEVGALFADWVAS